MADEITNDDDADSILGLLVGELEDAKGQLEDKEYEDSLITLESIRTRLQTVITYVEGKV